MQVIATSGYVLRLNEKVLTKNRVSISSSSVHLAMIVVS